MCFKQWPNGRFGAFSLAYPEHIPRALFDPLRIFKDKNKLADRNYEMWTDGTVHEMAPGAPLVTDPELIAFERARAAEAEAQDAAGEGSAEARFSCALRVDFLVALTFELNLWHWTTREVIPFSPHHSTDTSLLNKSFSLIFPVSLSSSFHSMSHSI